MLVLRSANGLKKSHIDALEFIVLTAQRIEAICLLERRQIELNEDGSGVVHWTADQMKSKQAHALWVPAEALRLVASKGKYAFPADDGGQRAIRPSVINRWLGNLWGKRPAPKKVDYDRVRALDLCRQS
jgi:hypothetical protein